MSCPEPAPAVFMVPQPCFRLICPSCKSLNIFDPIPKELSEEERLLAIEAGFSVCPGSWMTLPAAVRCPTCGLVVGIIMPPNRPPDDGVTCPE